MVVHLQADQNVASTRNFANLNLVGHLSVSVIHIALVWCSQYFEN